MRVHPVKSYNVRNSNIKRICGKVSILSGFRGYIGRGIDFPKGYIMKNQPIFALAIVLLFIGSGMATEPLVMGSRFSIASKILDEDRGVQVYLPDGYQSGTNHYPVLYQMDGDYNFHHVTGMVAFYSEIGLIPEMIVVGISAQQQSHYIKNLTPPHTEAARNGRSNLFLRFITEELTPMIEKNYRTRPYRILSGHSVGGLFVVNAFWKSQTVLTLIWPLVPVSGGMITPPIRKQATY